MEDGKNGQENTPFIEEKIVHRPMRSRTARSLVLAVICGIIAGICCFLTVKILSHFDSSGEKKPSVTQTAPSETKPEPESVPETTEAETQESAEETGAPDIGDVVDEKIEEKVEELIHLQADYTEELYEVFSASMLDVTVSRTGTDWLSHTYSSEGTVQSVIIRNDGTNLYLLVSKDATQGASALNVTVNDVEYPAEVVGTDSFTGIQILRVEPQFDENLVFDYPAAGIGFAGAMKPGSFVMAVGNPMGVPGSMNYGIVSFRDRYTNDPDYHYDLLYTDMVGSGDGSGVLINEKGLLVGWISGRFMNENKGGGLCAISMNQLSNFISRMIAGDRAGYLGVYGSDIPETQKAELGIDHGIYVRDVDPNSGAFAGGVQVGDIITKVGAGEVLTMKHLENLLSTNSAQSEVKLTVLRWSRDSYAEIELGVILGERP